MMLLNRLRSMSPYIVTGVCGTTAVCVFFPRFSSAYARGDSTPKSLKDARIVVVGGGYGGIQTALKLKDKCQLTLIDARDAFHHNMGAQRSAVEAGYARKCLLPYGPTFGDTFKQGKVVSIDPDGKTVKLASGERLPFDEVVIATGTGGPFPAKLPLDTNKVKAEAQYNMYNKMIKDAQKVVVIGGGAVGVEIAGDIKEDFAEKEVLLIHPREILVNDKVSESFQTTVKNRLTKLGVKMVLGERVTNMQEVKDKNFTDVTVLTDKGQSLKADLAIPCTGLKVNSVAYESSFPDKMDKLGRLKVGDYLEVKGIKDVYAIGDCNDVPEIKLAYQAGVQGGHVAENLKKKYEGKEMQPYKANESIFMVLSCGRSGGAAQLFGGWVFGDFVARMIKGENVFTPTQWKTMGQKMPE